jgi:predicted acyltransferase
VGRLLHPYFPINKSLWTSTFVLFTGGFALMLLAACYWAVDLRGWRKWAAPWLVFGMNAILAYVLAALVSEVSTDFEFHDSHGHLRTLHGWIYERYFVSHASSVNASLAFAIFFVFVIYLLLLPFYRRRIYVRI